MMDYVEKREYILPAKILAAEKVRGADTILHYRSDIASFLCKDPCVLAPGGYILLDFGREYQGGVKVVAQDMCGAKNAKIRIRFGESAMECCSEPGYKGASNDHSVRDEVLSLPWVGCLEYGMTGYRFIRIDNLESFAVSLIQILGISVHSGKEMIGSFRCSDPLVNEVWQASAYTIYLNNNKYLTDGIKRDRLVWIGDMHPETVAVLRLFGYDPSINRSLDYIRDITELPAWMNDIPSYSMWWIKIHRDLYWYTGDREYLAKQLPYMRELCDLLIRSIGPDGRDTIQFKFIDWPSSDQPGAQELGIRSLLEIALLSCKEIFAVFGDHDRDARIADALLRMAKRPVKKVLNKQAVSLAVFADIINAKEAEKTVFSDRPLQDLSTFLCYYVMQARAAAGNMCGSLEIIRKYYGAMLRLGATTMWEDFNLDWARGAKPIDSLLKEGEYDVHGDNGGYCYKGYRHSLCHGWAAGTVPFASEYILGAHVADIGCKKVRLTPVLGDLQWAEGVIPTPQGKLFVRAENKDGKMHLEYDAPSGVQVIAATQKEAL